MLAASQKLMRRTLSQANPILRKTRPSFTPKVSLIPSLKFNAQPDPPAKIDPDLQPKLVHDCDRLQAEWLAELCAMCPAWVEVASIHYQHMSVSVKLENAKKMILFLLKHSHSQMQQFNQLGCVDHIGKTLRFELIYCMNGWIFWNHIRVHTWVDELTPVESIADHFISAVGLECKAYDDYGVFFKGHPDLRRIRTDYGFQGWPMRKDFPLTGYVEIRYDDTLRRIVYEPVEMTQEIRQWDFLSPWANQGVAGQGKEGDFRTERDWMPAVPMYEDDSDAYPYPLPPPDVPDVDPSQPTGFIKP